MVVRQLPVSRKVIPFPRTALSQNRRVRMAGRTYRVRSGSFADWLCQLGIWDLGE